MKNANLLAIGMVILVTNNVYRGLLTGANLPRPVQEKLRSVGIAKSFRAGEAVFCPGDIITAFYLVDKGSFAFTRVTRDGNRALFGHHSEGGSFGLHPLVLGTPAVYYCEAVAEAALTCVVDRELRRLIDEDETVRWSIMQSVCQQLRLTQRALHEERMLPLGHRIARRLLDLAELDNKIMSSQSVIADFLGVSRVSVGKTLKEFQFFGYIEIGYGSITIVNADALRDYGSL